MNELDTKLAAAAREAYAVQDACNLSGVVFAFAKAMQLICDVAHRDGHGTEWKNTHPIVIAYADKIADLSGARDTMTVFRALDICGGFTS